MAWQMGRELTREVYELTATAGFRRDLSMVDQMRRAAVSIVSNIAEGFERRSRAEFSRFLMIACGSAGELRAQLYVVEDCGYVDAAVAQQLRQRAESVSRIIAALRRSVIQRMSQTGK